jgi:SHS2 domain-containing protein
VLTADTEQGVFAGAVRAFGALLDDGTRGPPRSYDVSVGARDRATLLAEFLEELVFLAETEGFVPGALAALELDDGSLRAHVRGRHGTPPHPVMAVQRLAFEPVAAGWRAHVRLELSD